MREQFTVFFGGPFSQWTISPFNLEGRHYPTAEHYMMWFKDQVFGGKLEKEILSAPTPEVAQALGRQIEGFDAKVWSAVGKHGVFVGSMAKFTQNPLLNHLLMETYGTTLVEASPFDRIWGVGLAETDPRTLDRATWDGTNLLGETLTAVRDALTLAYRCNDPEWADQYHIGFRGVDPR